MLLSKTASCSASSWFGGTYEEPGFDGWVYHTEHGWLFPSSSEDSELWAYAPDDGWFYTSESLYPWIYHQSGSWLHYYFGAVNPDDRCFWNNSTGYFQIGKLQQGIQARGVAFQPIWEQVKGGVAQPVFYYNEKYASFISRGTLPSGSGDMDYVLIFWAEYAPVADSFDLAIVTFKLDHLVVIGAERVEEELFRDWQTSAQVTIRFTGYDEFEVIDENVRALFDEILDRAVDVIEHGNPRGDKFYWRTRLPAAEDPNSPYNVISRQMLSLLAISNPPPSPGGGNGSNNSSAFERYKELDAERSSMGKDTPIPLDWKVVSSDSVR